MSKGEIEGNYTKSKRGSQKQMTDAREESEEEDNFGGRKKKSRATSARVTDRNKVGGENELNLRRESEDSEETKCKSLKYEERKQ